MIVKNFFWLSLTQGSRILRLIAVIYAARLLGAPEYGRFAYILGLLSILALFADSGLSELLTRDIARHKDRQSEYFVASFWLKTLLIVLTAALIYALGPYVTKIEMVRPLLYLSILLMAFDNLRELLIGYLRGLQRMEIETAIIAAMNLAILLGVLLALPWQPRAQTLLIIYILGSGLAVLLAGMFSRKIFVGIFRDFRATLAREILKNSWPLAAVIGLGTLYGLDMVMLGWWRTAGEIGLYSAGQRIVQGLAIVPTLIATAIFPALSSAVQNNEQEKARAINKKALAIVSLFTVLAVAGGIIFRQPIIRLFFGPEYAPAATSFAILLASALLTFPGALLVNIILAHNEQRRVVKYAVAGTGINLILNFLLIPPLGIAGAATATAIALAVNYALVWRAANQIIKKVSRQHPDLSPD
ncbi:MAG: flippase [Candidatus Doudnabacteria bacterium]|nr:flippase [Candidatus Doudnabacteria bacterium]